MKKEVLLAIVIGFGIGLLITFGIYVARTAVQQQKAQASPSPIAQTSAEPSSSPSVLTITEPKPDTLTSTDSTTVNGKAVPESTITITTEDSQKIVVADKTGVYSTEVELTGGANEIKVSSFAPDGTKAETSITIVYSTAEI